MNASLPRFLVLSSFFLTACDSGKQGSTGGGGTGANGGSASGGAGVGTGGANATGGGAGANAGGAGVTGGTTSAGSSGDGGSATGGSAGGAGAAAASGSAGSAGAPFTGDPMVYVGGYDPNVRSYRLARATGELTEAVAPVNFGTNPAYLAVDPSRSYLYAANETDGAQGGVTPAAIAADGALTPLARRGAENLGFVHLAVSPLGRFLVAASYNDGAVVSFPIGINGELDAAVEVIRFTGDPVQSHCVAFDRTGNYVFVPNKGQGNIAQFSFEQRFGGLDATVPATVATAADAGPRHIATHPTRDFAYVINELDSTMTSYGIGAGGILTPIETESTLPASYDGQNTGAHVEVSPDGTLLFGSNRGHDSIVVYSIDQSTGALTLVEHEPTRGMTPRDFDVDPAGRYVVVANQGSDNLAVFSISASGLTPVGDVVTGVTNPAAVQFVYLP